MEIGPGKTLYDMMPNMKESVLQYTWQFRRYDVRYLHTTSGQPVQVLHPGYRNRDGGPDFLDARIVIGELEWRGHVEVHRKSSEWLLHGHQHDAKYHNVILHVVYEDDLPGEAVQGIPVLEMNGRIPMHILRTCKAWQDKDTAIPCGQQASTVDTTTWLKWKERLLVDRLEWRNELFTALVNQHQGDKEVATWHLLCRYLVTPPNRAAMDTLFSGFNWRQLWKVRDDLFQLEAILLGQAGFLSGHLEDMYGKQLQAEYAYQQEKLDLHPMPVAMWQYLRMRPGAFPPLRVALVAAILHRTHQLYETITEDPEGFVSWICATSLSPYWQQHYRLDKKARSSPAFFGTQMKASLLANVVVPVLYAHAQSSHQPEKMEETLELLAKMPPERNYKLAAWEKCGVVAGHLADSQALLHLRDRYCERKKCLDCAIGHKLLGERPGDPMSKLEEEEFYYAPEPV